MSGRFGRGMPHLAAALDQPGVLDAGAYVEPARLAERGGLDFVTLDDSFARPGPDALGVLSRVAPATRRIGLVPTVTTTHTEPVRVQAAVATLDWVSRGRADWRIEVSTTEGEARLSGRRHAAPADALWREAGEVADVAGRLWDSWIGRRRITPGLALYALERVWGTDLSGYDPDGPLPATGPGTRDGRVLALAERWRALSAEKGLSIRETVIEASGRQSFVGTPDSVAADLHRYAGEGAADGFVLVPGEPADGLEEFVDRVVPLLQERGAFRTEYRGGTLRSHLGLSHPERET